MNSPRVLMFSARNFRKWTIMCDHFDCEDVIASIDDVHLASPQAVFRGTSAIAQGIFKAARRYANLSITPEPSARRIYLNQSYDLFFFRVASLGDLRLLRYVPQWRKRCKQAICWMDELWAKQLAFGRNPTSILHALEVRELNKFDHVVLPFAGTIEPLSKLIRPPVHWMPFAVDTLRFSPWPNPLPRHIDFLAMGRKSMKTHVALHEIAARRRWMYLYDTASIRKVINAPWHRSHTIELAKQTRFFLANRAKVNRPEETAGQQEMGFRFFEGAAAGALLIGELPDTSEFRRCFPHADSAINLPFDSTNIAGILDEWTGNPSRMARTSRENVRECLLHHDWAHRWNEILQLARLRPNPRLRQRLARLRLVAAQVPLTSADHGSRNKIPCGATEYALLNSSRAHP